MKEVCQIVFHLAMISFAHFRSASDRRLIPANAPVHRQAMKRHKGSQRAFCHFVFHQACIWNHVNFSIGIFCLVVLSWGRAFPWPRRFVGFCIGVATLGLWRFRWKSEDEMTSFSSKHGIEIHVPVKHGFYQNLPRPPLGNQCFQWFRFEYSIPFIKIFPAPTLGNQCFQWRRSCTTLPFRIVPLRCIDDYWRMWLVCDAHFTKVKASTLSGWGFQSLFFGLLFDPKLPNHRF